MDPRAELWYATGTRRKDRKILEQVFLEAGIEVEYQSHDPPVDSWADYHVVLAIPGAGASAFLTAYCVAAGPDAWDATNELLQQLSERTEEEHRPPDGEQAAGGPPKWLLRLLGAGREWELELELVETEKGAHIMLRSSYPDDAFKKLFELETERDTWYAWDGQEWTGVPPDALRV